MALPLRDEPLEVEVARLRQRVAELEAEQQYGIRSADLLPLINSLPILLIVVDERQRAITLWNREAERVTGYGASEIVGRADIFELFFPDPQYRDLLVQTWQRIAGNIRNWELQLTTRHGQQRTIAWSSVVPESPIGRAGTLWIGVDVSDRKSAELERLQLLHQVREQSQQLEEVINAVPVGVALLDADLRVAMANMAAAAHLKRLGLAGSDKPLTHLGTQSMQELIASTQSGVRQEFQAGDQVYQALICPAAGVAGEQRWVLVLDDVTREQEVRERAQSQDRLAAVGQLAAGIAHDFNNMLAVIVLHAQLGLLQPQLSARLTECFDIILGQAMRAGDLVQQILDFSRRAVLERRPLSLAPFLKEQVKLLARTLPENINLRLESGFGDYVISADPTRLQQVIVNLAVNARDAMPEGGQMRFSLERLTVDDTRLAPLPELTPGAWITLSVTDSGCGIPAHVLPHIFEPFYTTKAPLGTGLGLAQVHGIVKQHEGEIGVVSSEGIGTTFTIYLPATAPAKTAAQSKVEDELPSGSGETILVVEDDASVRTALVASLLQLNYHAVAANDGEEALTILDSGVHSVMLVLSDLVMPTMGGYALLHAMRARGITAPVIFVSGHPMDGQWNPDMRDGPAAWLQKPITLDLLASSVAKIVAPRA